MKIIIPETIGDITVKQYQKYIELTRREDLSIEDLNIRKIHIFTGLKIEDVRKISIADYNEIINLIDKALEVDNGFKDKFFIGELEFGFIPNLNKITAGEFIDIEKYQSNIEDMHKLMAIFFRPIDKKDAFGNYSIIPYQGTEQYSEVMKLMPLNCANGALVFFSNLSNELMSYTQRFLNQEQAKVNKQAITL